MGTLDGNLFEYRLSQCPYHYLYINYVHRKMRVYHCKYIKDAMTVNRFDGILEYVFIILALQIDTLESTCSTYINRRQVWILL